jgi:site-specific recombinase XerD
MGLRPDHPDFEVLKAFARYQRLRGLSPETIRREAIVLTAFGRDTAVRLLEATTDDIQEFLDSRRLQDRTRSSYISYFAAFYRWAVRDERTERDPTIRLIRPKLPRTLPRPMSSSDLARALAEADDRMRLWLCLAAYQGFRAAEIAGLRVEDIQFDLARPLIHVRGKGGRERIVPLNRETERAMHAYGMPTRGALFQDPERVNPFRPGTVTKYISEYLHGIGIDATAHRGRHWFATEVYDRTKDLLLTKELLGHSSVMTTEIYAALRLGSAAGTVRDLSVEPL